MSFGSLLSGGMGLAKAAGGKGGGKGGAGSSGQDSAQAEWQHMEDLNKIRSRYADLGLGGSTMEAMDEAGAGLGFLANQENYQTQQQQLANQTLGAQTSALSSLSNIANQRGQQGAVSAGVTSGTPAAAGPVSSAA